MVLIPTNFTNFTNVKIKCFKIKCSKRSRSVSNHCILNSARTSPTNRTSHKNAHILSLFFFYCESLKLIKVYKKFQCRLDPWRDLIFTTGSNPTKRSELYIHRHLIALLTILQKMKKLHQGVLVGLIQTKGTWAHGKGIHHLIGRKDLS